MSKKIKVVSRSSNLALVQVKEVMSQFPDIDYELISIDSYGDKNKDISLMDNISADFFTRELDLALLENKADIAIHSAKDLPFPLPEGLELYALTKADDKSDSLISKNGLKLCDLPKGARVGTSSHSRKEQLLSKQPDLEIVSIRGTIEERIAQVDSGRVDALIVATCALKRLGLSGRIAKKLPFDTHPLQGNLAIIGRRHNPQLRALFAPIDIRNVYGKVYLVGAGPGDKELLTIKADKLLRSADVIVYDALIDESLLNSYSARRVYVGKKKGFHTKQQNDINYILYEEAKKGNRVVRLKGGDPLVFGRGGEEYQYLRERLVDVEIIPGITSGIGAASFTGISLTHRGISSSVAFLSGHPIEKFKPLKADTLVIYMGTSVLPQITSKLIDDGWSSDTPLVIVKSATMPNQSEIKMTLGEALKYERDDDEAAIVILGEVVGNYSKPTTVLATGTEYQRFSHLGKIIHTPLIELCPLKDYSDFDNKSLKLADYDMLIFTSKYSVRYFFERLPILGYDARTLSGIVIVSIGKRTSEELAKHSINADIVPSKESSEGLVEMFKNMNISSNKIFIPRSKRGRSILQEELTALGNEVDNVPVYENKLPQNVKKVDLDDIDKIAFSSPSGVNNFVKLYGGLPRDKIYLSVGKVTTISIREVLPDAVVEEVTHPTFGTPLERGGYTKCRRGV